MAVVSGAWSDYTRAHPTTALLVVEIAHTTLQYDRLVKATLYAAAGIPEYCIVNLELEIIEVYREPQRDTAALWGASYGRMERIARGASLSPMHAPGATLRSDELLPPAALP